MVLLLAVPRLLAGGVSAETTGAAGAADPPGLLNPLVVGAAGVAAIAGAGADGLLNPLEEGVFATGAGELGLLKLGVLEDVLGLEKLLELLGLLEDRLLLLELLDELELLEPPLAIPGVAISAMAKVAIPIYGLILRSMVFCPKRNKRTTIIIAEENQMSTTMFTSLAYLDIKIWFSSFSQQLACQQGLLLQQAFLPWASWNRLDQPWALVEQGVVRLLLAQERPQKIL